MITPHGPAPAFRASFVGRDCPASIRGIPPRSPRRRLSDANSFRSQSSRGCPLALRCRHAFYPDLSPICPRPAPIPNRGFLSGLRAAPIARIQPLPFPCCPAILPPARLLPRSTEATKPWRTRPTPAGSTSSRSSTTPAGPTTKSTSSAFSKSRPFRGAAPPLKARGPGRSRS